MSTKNLILPFFSKKVKNMHLTFSFINVNAFTNNVTKIVYRFLVPSNFHSKWKWPSLTPRLKKISVANILLLPPVSASLTVILHKRETS